MHANEGTWFYVSLDAPGREPIAVRLIGDVQAPGGVVGLLAEPLNRQLFNSHRLLLVPSEGQNEITSATPESFVPVRTFSANHLEPGQTVTAAAVQPSKVLDIAGITLSREVADSWSHK